MQILNYFKTLIQEDEEAVSDGRVNELDAMNKRVKVYEYLHRMLFAGFVVDEWVQGRLQYFRTNFV